MYCNHLSRKIFGHERVAVDVGAGFVDEIDRVFAVGPGRLRVAAGPIGVGIQGDMADRVSRFSVQARVTTQSDRHSSAAFGEIERIDVDEGVRVVLTEVNPVSHRPTPPSARAVVSAPTSAASTNRSNTADRLQVALAATTARVCVERVGGHQSPPQAEHSSLWASLRRSCSRMASHPHSHRKYVADSPRMSACDSGSTWRMIVGLSVADSTVVWVADSWIDMGCWAETTRPAWS